MFMQQNNSSRFTPEASELPSHRFWPNLQYQVCGFCPPPPQQGLKSNQKTVGCLVTPMALLYQGAHCTVITVVNRIYTWPRLLMPSSSNPQIVPSCTVKANQQEGSFLVSASLPCDKYVFFNVDLFVWFVIGQKTVTSYMQFDVVYFKTLIEIEKLSISHFLTKISLNSKS